MTAASTDAVDLLRFLALSLEVHTDALCCAIDDVEAAIVESSINDELMDRLEEELAGLLDRQRRLHAGHAVIVLAQRERQRGSELRREPLLSTTQPWGDKRIQTSRAHARGGNSTGGKAGPSSRRNEGNRSPPPTGLAGTERGDSVAREEAERESEEVVSTRGLSTCEGSLEADIAAIDRLVEQHKAKIEELDCFSLRGKLLQLEKMKKAVKDIDMEELVESTVSSFEFPPAVRALWTPSEASSSSSQPALTSSSYTSSVYPSSVALRNSPSRNNHPHSRHDVSLAQHAAGKGDVVNHTNIDLLLARACQRLAGRSVDALEALASTNLSEESPAAHVLGCTVYAAEFERSAQGELRDVMSLQTAPRDSLARLYRRWERASVCTAKVAASCFGARGTVLAAQDFSALPADWTTTQSLSRVPLEEVLPPIRHLLSPRFTFANVAELKTLQATRVNLQRKIVHFLLGGQETSAELLRQVRGAEADRTVASARLAVAETTPATVSGHAWKTMIRISREE